MATIPAVDFTPLLSSIPKGSWVAISSDHSRVIAFGSDLLEVFEEAHQGGERNAIIMRVPDANSSLIF